MSGWSIEHSRHLRDLLRLRAVRAFPFGLPAVLGVEQSAAEARASLNAKVVYWTGTQDHADPVGRAWELVAWMTHV